ncbi:MAG: hypothetical protein K8R88_06395 [Armatimonadetes bacterium]|nr:hypothetical protein [Armatimonadota bacterium]
MVIFCLAGFSFCIYLHFLFLHLRRTYPLFANQSGLRLSRKIGPTTVLCWSDIDVVDVVRPFINLRCPKIDVKPIKVPLFLEDQQGFYDYVCAHAPADNPLRVWIEALPERNLLIHKK